MFRKHFAEKNHAEKLFADGLMALIGARSPFLKDCIARELKSQREALKLIASENYSSLAVQAALGTLFTDKYSEGYPFHRFYSGCEVVDELEDRCAAKCRELFGADFAYVQPHSGADANLCAYWAILNARVQTPMLEKFGLANPAAATRDDFNAIREACHNQRLLALDYYSGGHLTHGYRFNVSAQMFDVHTYGVSEETLLLDYDDMEKKALEIRPLVILAGYSAYARKIDFARMRSIADKAGSVLMVDMAHFAGLVAGKVFSGKYDPVPYADIVTSTTHKTLRGPRGGIILCREWLRPHVEKGCPLVIGGPQQHSIAAKLVSFEEADTPGFREYAKSIVRNSQALARRFVGNGLKVVTGGTDNHMVLLDVSPLGINGRQAESALREAGVSLNRNALPFDSNGPWYTSGLRLGTAALTTRGLGVREMEEIADIISSVLKTVVPRETEKDGRKVLSKSMYDADPSVMSAARKKISGLLARFPLYPEFGVC